MQDIEFIPIPREKEIIETITVKVKWWLTILLSILFLAIGFLLGHL